MENIFDCSDCLSCKKAAAAKEKEEEVKRDLEDKKKKEKEDKNDKVIQLCNFPWSYHLLILWLMLQFFRMCKQPQLLHLLLLEQHHQLLL